MPCYAFQRDYDDFDALAADALAWDLELTPRRRGVFEGRIEVSAWGPVQLGRARFKRDLIQRGAPPVGHWTFVIPARGSSPFRWRGREVGADEILVFPLGGELHAVSGADFEILTIAIQVDHLARVAQAQHLPDPARLIGTAEVLACPPTALRALRRILDQLLLVARGGMDSGHPETRSRLTQELPRLILEAVWSAQGRKGPVARPRLALVGRMNVLLAAEALPTRSIQSVRSLSATLGVSERTLRRSCQEAYGCGPKELLLSRGLNNVRRQLRQSDPVRTRIADVAHRFGFWHMGQLAADYRRQFGELPRETLAKSSQGQICRGISPGR